MLSTENYGPVEILPSMDAPIRSWSMQSGGFIFIEQGGQRVRLSPDDLAQLLVGHSNEHVVYDLIYNDNATETTILVEYRNPKRLTQPRDASTTPQRANTGASTESPEKNSSIGERSA